MAEIKITIPDPVVGRLIDAIALEYDYVRTKLSSETKGQFAKRMLIEDWAKRILREQEGRNAGEAARATAASAADSQVSIT